MRFSMMWPSALHTFGAACFFPQEVNFNMLQDLLRVTFREIDKYNISHFIHFSQLTCSLYKALYRPNFRLQTERVHCTRR